MVRTEAYFGIVRRPSPVANDSHVAIPEPSVVENVDLAQPAYHHELGEEPKTDQHRHDQKDLRRKRARSLVDGHGQPLRIRSNLFCFERSSSRHGLEQPEDLESRGGELSRYERHPKNFAFYL